MCKASHLPELSELPCAFRVQTRLQGVLRQCAAVTRCLEVGDMGEGSVTAPGVKKIEGSQMSGNSLS